MIIEIHVSYELQQKNDFPLSKIASMVQGF